MVTVKPQTYGLTAKLASGSTVHAALSECGTATCYVFIAPDGGKTRLALSPEGVAVVQQMHDQLRWRDSRLELAKVAHGIKPNVPLSWLYLMEWASGQSILHIKEDACS